MDERHAELEQLRRAMETRPVIDQAHGVLMAAYGCTPDRAWEVLVAVSQRTNTKLHRVASALVGTTQGQSLDEPLRSALRAALKATKPDEKPDERNEKDETEQGA
ncbi:ANTAR domain-containing protein [Streptomyces sp. Amel2xB2]|uniref:ANTAR domain-containing protein n=1 Tax=Streptomyces sp. Amel2xB2 TaxID=1305829 RepID=UPI000DBF97A7|nr:ANTAR domain-containing protein [Streptomyces sp. Amel2xB2]RAJ67020.1 ANTAR domain-containing protein [Streptomyces sp. Amel2xB2]